MSKVEPVVVNHGFVERIAEKRSVPGVLSFSASMELLYMNSAAQELSEQIVYASQGGEANGDLPSEIPELCLELQKMRDGHPDPKARDRVQVQKVIGNVKFPVLIRGFIIPSPEEAGETRYLILMEKIGRRGQIVPNEVKKRFNLTDREHEIVMHVADGRTNKEIAGILSISEHTVKEHIKHILRKTHSTTRTGILAQIFRFS